jgi:Domain of unknown function (DUF4389)
MTSEDPRPDLPAAPDDPTVSSVVPSADEIAAAETTAAAEETNAAAAETAAAAAETEAAVAKTEAAAAETTAGAQETAAAAAETTAGAEATAAAAAATVAAAAAVPPPAPPAVPPAPPAPPVGWAAPPPSGPDRYPINVRFDRDQRIGRFWAIPIIGWFARWLVLIPHFILLWAWGIVVFFAMLVTWIPVLLTGRFPDWGYEIVGGFYRWYIRVFAYLLLLAGPYPPFSPTAPYPVEVDFDRDTRLNNLWGIPLLGIWLRGLLAIPHLIILWFLGIAAYLIVLVAWIPVLVNGRYPQIGYEIVGGLFRWYTRVGGWIALMAGPYPPFRLDE